MKLHSLHIKNFKSIADIQLTNLSTFAVFAGANGVGKSNLFSALEFYKFVVDVGAVNAVKRFEGYKSIHCRKLRKENARKFFCELRLELDGVVYDHRLEVLSLDKEPYLKEVFKIDGKEVAKRDQQTLTVHSQPIALSLAQDQTLLNVIVKESEPFLRFVKSICRYSIDPNQARLPDDLSSETVLDSSASNIATVLANLEQTDKVAVTEIIETMQMLVPSLETIKVKPEHLVNKMVSTFKEYGTKESFPAHLVSDGTIYALAILAIIYSNQHGIIMIEEPERGLNPKAIAELVDFFREKTGQYVVFLNTHNESIVKKLHPEELYIVSKLEGKTQVFNVKDRFPHYDYAKMDLNSMWLSNFFGEGLPW